MVDTDALALKALAVCGQIFGFILHSLPAHG
jgi:hypothetical protein